jgi:zinc/manganese transport system substrate-binding protein
MNRRLLAAPLLIGATALTLAGCAANPSDAGSTSEGISVVASTNVWGDVASTIGGDAVSVTSIIDSPDKDPHEYEADAQNQLALSKADVVIENGGGYDDFVDTMLDSAGNSSAVVLNAVEISGNTASDGEEVNEHVWYDFPSVEMVIDEIEASYAKLDPDNAATFEKNAGDLKAQIGTLEDQEADLNGQYAGAGVSITEPVPLYMLDAIGLDNKTPAEFSEAIEEGTDVPATVLQQTLALYSDHAVELLVYNEQTAGPQTEEVLTAAKDNAIPVVPVTETLPDGTTYVSWMGDNLDAISAALAQ